MTLYKEMMLTYNRILHKLIKKFIKKSFNNDFAIDEFRLFNLCQEKASNLDDLTLTKDETLISNFITLFHK